MKISMIAAMASGRVIGAGNKMPWHLPADLKHFKSVTMGKPVLMGRKTYESIGKALPGRLNIVLTSDPNYSLLDAEVVHSCEQGLALARAAHSDDVELMVIGGGSVYQHFLAYCHRLYITDIDLDVSGDTYFPDYTKEYQWQKIDTSTHSADEKNPHSCTFSTLDKLGAVPSL